MKATKRDYRRRLERTVVEARDIAEAGAWAALDVLGVPRICPAARRALAICALGQTSIRGKTVPRRQRA